MKIIDIIPIAILVVTCFGIGLVIGSRLETNEERGMIVEQSEDRYMYSITDYGVFDLSIPLLYVSKPEELGVTYAVTFAYSNGAVVYRYFTSDTDAWTFYSMLRMLYGIEEKNNETFKE
jgi:hypothetical protein